MIVLHLEQRELVDRRDLLNTRKLIAEIALKLGMSSMKETELRTAATELMSNILRYAGSGAVSVEELEHSGLRGIRATFRDQGPGIADLSQVMSKGFSTGKSLGHGLSGCKNLVDSFKIESEPGKGTCVVITKWC